MYIPMNTEKFDRKVGEALIESYARNGFEVRSAKHLDTVYYTIYRDGTLLRDRMIVIRGNVTTVKYRN